MDHVEYVYTGGIDADEVDDLVRDRDHGVLSLARDDEAYAVPVNYHYDGERVRFRLGADPEDKKIAFATATTTATLVVYDVGGPEDAWSVVVRGPIRRLTDDERAAVDDAEINEDFPPFHLFDETVESVDIALYELDPDEITGRRTVE